MYTLTDTEKMEIAEFVHELPRLRYHIDPRRCESPSDMEDHILITAYILDNTLGLGWEKVVVLGDRNMRVMMEVVETYLRELGCEINARPMTPYQKRNRQRWVGE